MPSMMTSPGRSEDWWSGCATGFMRMLYPIQAAVLSVRTWTPPACELRASFRACSRMAESPFQGRVLRVEQKCLGGYDAARGMQHRVS